MKGYAVVVYFGKVLYRWVTLLLVGGDVLPRNHFNLCKVGACINILENYSDLLAVRAGYPNCDGCICTLVELPGVLRDVAVECVGSHLLEGDICVNLLLVDDFAPSCLEVTEKAADGVVGVSDVVLLQFFDLLGIYGVDDEFHGNVGDRELCPPFSPEDVLVRFEDQLIESGCVQFYRVVDFARLREFAVCEGAAGCAVEVSVGESEW